MLAPSTSCRNRTGQYCGEPRLIQLYDEIRAGHSPTYLGNVLLQAVREPVCQITASTMVGQHLVAPRQLYCGGQRPRTGALDLQRPGVAVGNLFEGVEVLLQQGPSPALV